MKYKIINNKQNAGKIKIIIKKKKKKKKFLSLCIKKKL
jgi:hypothetical protein